MFLGKVSAAKICSDRAFIVEQQSDRSLSLTIRHLEMSERQASTHQLMPQRTTVPESSSPLVCILII